MPVSRNRRIPKIDKNNRTKARRVLRKAADVMARTVRHNLLVEHLRSRYADRKEW